MNKFKYCLMAAALMTVTAVGFTSCGDDDDVEKTDNPAEPVVKAAKTKDTAILLCSFGSTYHEATHVYDETVKEFKKLFLKQMIICLFHQTLVSDDWKLHAMKLTII